MDLDLCSRTPEVIRTESHYTQGAAKGALILRRPCYMVYTTLVDSKKQTSGWHWMTSIWRLWCWMHISLMSIHVVLLSLGGHKRIFICDQATLWMELSVWLSGCLSVTPFKACSKDHMATIFYDNTANDKRLQRHKFQCPRSKVKVTEVNICHFTLILKYMKKHCPDNNSSIIWNASLKDGTTSINYVPYCLFR